MANIFSSDKELEELRKIKWVFRKRIGNEFFFDSEDGDRQLRLPYHRILRDNGVKVGHKYLVTDNYLTKEIL